MSFLYFLENLRMPGLNEFFLLITQLGEETAFLVAAILIFWCVDKRKGYYVMTVGFFGTMMNQFLKLMFQVPRPWVIDPNFTILEQAREAATGFSFPSGHSTSAVGTFGAIAAFTQIKWIRSLCIAICVLVPFSRMYIGVHTPLDVIVGAATALVFVLVLERMVKGVSDRAMKDIIWFMLLCAAALTVFASFYPFDIGVEALHNLESGVKNGYTMMGCTAGLLIGYPLERKYVNFETKAVWWVQILKSVLGLLVVLAVKEGLRAPLDALFAGHMVARAVRYALIVIVAGVLWPATFKWFNQLGEKNELRGNQKL